MLRNILQPFYTFYVLIVFLITVLFIFPFIVVLGVWNNDKSRLIIYFILKNWAKFWLYVIGMPITKIGKIPKSGNYVVVANHVSYLDSIALLPTIPGYFRPLGKKEISNIPLIGHIYTQIVIMVDRSSHNSRAKSIRQMWHVLKNGGNIAIFPEGTFNETLRPLKEFYDGAFRLAINNQVDILPIIFPDTINRWHYNTLWKLWPGKNRAVFINPISTKGLKLENLPALKQLVFTKMEAVIIEITEQERYNNVK